MTRYLDRARWAVYGEDATAVTMAEYISVLHGGVIERGSGASIDANDGPFRIVGRDQLKERHKGPGLHPSGSPQDVHAGDDAKEIERYPGDDKHGDYSKLLERMKQRHLDGKFAMIGRDQETSEFLFITDRETAIEHVGELNRNANGETFYAFNKIEMFFRKRGFRTRVPLASYDVSDLRGFAEEAHQFGSEITIVHNHPEQLETYMPPSSSDLQLQASIHADESRIYTGDGTYTVRMTEFGNKKAFHINNAVNEYNEDHSRDVFPESYHLSPQQQENFMRNRGMGPTMKQYQLDRLDALAERFDWLSYEFKPNDE